MPSDKVQIIIEVDGRQMKVEVGQIAQAISGIGDKAKTAGATGSQGLSKVASAAEHTKQSLAGAVLAANLLTNAITSLARGLKSITIDSALYAARTQVLGTVLQNMARVNGISAQTIGEQETKIKKLGITTQEARSSLARFIQAQLDVTKAAQLARVAQDAGVVGNVNSAEALERLTHGIVTLQPEVLRTIGITVNFEQEYTKFAKTAGRTVESLSQQEKQQIALNVVLREGGRLAGTYEAAMGDVGKQITSLVRYLGEAKDAIGQQFLPALSVGVKALTEFLKFTQQAPDLLTGMAFTLVIAGVSMTRFGAAVAAFNLAKLAAIADVLAPVALVVSVVALTIEWLNLQKAMEEYTISAVDAKATTEKLADTMAQKYGRETVEALRAGSSSISQFVASLGKLDEASVRAKASAKVLQEAGGDLANMFKPLAQVGPVTVGQLPAGTFIDREIKTQEALAKLTEKFRIDRLKGAQKEVAQLNEGYRTDLEHFTGNQEQMTRLALLYAQQRAFVVAEAQKRLREAAVRYVEPQPADLEKISRQFIEDQKSLEAARETIRKENQEATLFSLKLEQDTRLAMATTETEKLRIQYEIDTQNFELSELRKTLSKEEAASFRALIEKKYQAEAATLEVKQREKLQHEAERTYKKLFDNISDHAGHAFDTIFQKGKSVFAGLTDFIKGIWLTMLRKLFADTVAGLLTPLFSAIRGGTAGNASGGILGSILGPVMGGGGGGGLSMGLPGIGPGGTAPFFPSGGGGTGGGVMGGLRNIFSLGGSSGGGGFSPPFSLAAGGAASAASSFAFGGLPLASAGMGMGLPGSVMAASTVPGLATAGWGSGAAASGWGATHGLMGVSFSSMGHLLSTVGGFLLTNPIGWAIMAGITALALYKIFHKSRQDKFRAEILRDFALNVQDKNLLTQIKQIGDSTFGSLADKKRFETLRLDNVQAMLMAYAQQTGQSPSMLPLYQRFYGSGGATPINFDQAGAIPKFGSGGIVPGIDQGRDSVLALLRPGERVLTREQSGGINYAPTYNIDARESKDPAETARQVKRALLGHSREVADAFNRALRSDYKRREIFNNLMGDN